MSKGTESTGFALNLEGNAAEQAKLAALSMQELREKIGGAKSSISEMSAQLKNLKSASFDVSQESQELKNKIQAEKQTLALATIEEIKNGKASKDLAEKKKELADASAKAATKSKALSSALGVVGGPIAGIREKFNALRETFKSASASGDLLKIGLLATSAAVVVAVAAIGAALAGAAVAISHFIISGADAARTAALFRQSAMEGNAQWGKNFGEQVDALAKNIPTSKAEIDKLGASLFQSRVFGQTWVDSLSAISQASAALGEGAGAKLQEFITRGRVLQNFRVNPQELFGSGLEFQELAQSLAKNMKIGVDKAKAALVAGKVKLGDGAKALRDAVERKYASINLAKMLSLDSLREKFGETLQSLTKDIDLTPLLQGLKDIAHLFDTSTRSGQAVKQLLEVFGKGLVSTFLKAKPLIEDVILNTIIGAQELTIAFLRTRNSVSKTFGDINKKLDLSGAGMTALRIAAAGITASIVGLGASLAVVAAGAYLVFHNISLAFKFIEATGNALGDFVFKVVNMDWAATGAQILEGIGKGIRESWGKLKATVADLGSKIKDTFKGALKIQSPSKVFEEYGKFTTEGYSRGVQKGTPEAQSSVDGMVSPERSMSRGGALGVASARGAASSSAGASISITVPITITVPSVAAKEIAEAVKSAAGDLAETIVLGLQQAGIAT